VLSNVRLAVILAAHPWSEGDGMRMGWLMTLVLVIAATVLPIAVGQLRAQEMQRDQTEKCSLPKGWDPAEDLPRILKEHHEWFARWSHTRANKF
jgi:hypothetical protein